MVAMDAAKKIRSDMAARGISVQQLAKTTGISYQRLWNKLHGRTALNQGDLETIANALGTPVASSQTASSQPTPQVSAPQAAAVMDGGGKRFAIVVSRWNELITKELLAGALDEFARHGEPQVQVLHVPGTWEIPVAARALLAGASPPQAVVALGCIMQGQTAHAGLLGGDVGSALMSLQVNYGVPIAWGILTPETQDQALDRAGLKMGNKGREAALAAIEMAGLLTRL